jgi:L-ascorbate metabolism protein UlaG (beta-lactamase superfamily)
MEIKYIAHSSFVIKTKTATLITDPFGAQTGPKYPKVEADIVTVSHDHADHNNVSVVGGSPIVLDWPGEYEVKSISVTGIPSFHDSEQGTKRGKNVLFKIVAENLTLLHCGDLGHVPDDDLVDRIGPIDVLFVPVGGHYTVDAASASHVVKKLDPFIVIPMHFASPKLNQKMFGELQPVEEFLKVMGASGQIPVPKLTLKHEDFANDSTTKVVLLESTA